MAQREDLFKVVARQDISLALNVAAMVGFVLERGEDWKLLWWLPLQRFGYRQIMYYVVVRSLWTALRGPFVGWGKLERHGTVRARA